jgi:hypothetical protein
MPSPWIITCGSGGLVTSAFVIDKPATALAVFSPESHSASDVRIDFASASGTGFSTLQRPGGEGLPFSVMSRAGVGCGVVPYVPTIFARLSFVSSQVTVCSYVVLPVTR